MPFFAFPPEVRNAIRNKGRFPSDEADLPGAEEHHGEVEERPQGSGMLPRRSSPSSSATDLC